VPLLIVDAVSQDASSRGLVNRIGAGQVVAIRRQEVRLQNRVDADQPLHRLILPLGLLERVHECHDLGIGGFGHLRVGSKLGQALAERVAVLGQVPDVTSEKELCGELGRQRDPTPEGPHRALDHVPVIAQESSRMVHAEEPVQRVRHARQ
jgi:hypothetical protein